MDMLTFYCRYRCLWVLLAIFAILLTGCVAREPNLAHVMEKSRTYYVNHDYRRAFQYTAWAAHFDVPEAQYALGYMYYYGQGVVEDKHQADFWVAKAAEQGYPAAQQALTALKKEKLPVNAHRYPYG